MLISLTEFEDWLADKIERVLLLAPVSMPGKPGDEPDLSFESMTDYTDLRDLGVYSLPSYNWEMDRTLLCYESSFYYCAFSRFLVTPNYPGVISAKNLAHKEQMKKAMRFQPFIEDWSYPDNHSAPEWDLKTISKVPITLLAGEKDTISYPERVEWLADRLSTLQGYYMFKGWDHYTF